MNFELDKFVFGRVLNEGEPILTLNRPIEPHSRHADPATHSVALLGTVKSDIPDAQPAKSVILRIERTALPSFSDGIIASTKLIETTDIVSYLSTHVLCPSLFDSISSSSMRGCWAG